jgi:hypothetical protein
MRAATDTAFSMAWRRMGAKSDLRHWYTTARVRPTTTMAAEFVRP